MAGPVAPGVKIALLIVKAGIKAPGALDKVL
jgi:hypothetical protein